MRCLYCDRSLGILRFRVTEPFCSLEHRTLHYRKSDPPLAKLLNADPHLVDQAVAPAMGEWIPALVAQARQEAWPSQMLRNPEVTSTGLVIDPIRALAEVEPSRVADQPTPVEFSSSVYVVPPGDEELMAAELRDKILKTSDFAATLRFTLATSPARKADANPAAPVAGMYGPETQELTPSHPVSVPVQQAIESTGPCRPRASVVWADIAAFQPAEMDVSSLVAVPVGLHRIRLEVRKLPGATTAVTLGVAPMAMIATPAAESTHPEMNPQRTGQLDGTPVLRLPGVSGQKAESPKVPKISLSMPFQDFTRDAGIARLDPIRPHSRITFGLPRKTLGDSRLLVRHAQFESGSGTAKAVSTPTYPINTKELMPLRARCASVFAPVLPGPRRTKPLQKTPQDAEHLT